MIMLKFNIMNTCKIKFTAVSIGWTEGGIMRLSVKANAGSDISVDWGDGRNNTNNKIT